MPEEQKSKFAQIQESIKKARAELTKGTLIEEVMNAPDLDPSAKLGEDETVLGDMTTWEKKLYSSATEYRKCSDILGVKIKWDPMTMEEKEKSHSLRVVSKDVGDALMGLLWAEIRHRLNLADVNLGVRTEFKIVTFERSEHPSKAKIIALLEQLQRTSDD